MAQRQIPFLHARKLADGSLNWVWKPSPRLRAAGWEGRSLGRDRQAAILQALELNRQLEEWQQARIGAPAAPAPRKWLFADLVNAYRAAPEYAEDIAASTRREYDVRLRQLSFWADDGRLPVRALDQAMVRDLKAALLANGGSKFKCAATLRVLRLLLNWARGRGIVAVNATDGVAIPGTDSREAHLLLEQMEHCAGIALDMGWPVIARAFRFGFWTMQRESDLLALARMQLRQFENCDARHRPLLAGPDGEVRGFRLRQVKTGAWIDAPLPPFLHAEAEQAFAQGQWLLADPLDARRPMPPHRLQRQARAVLDKAGLAGMQFRDLRRSGMVFLLDHGALPSDVFVISGHAVMGRRTIADTYMPPDTRRACSAMATALAGLAQRHERERSVAAATANPSPRGPEKPLDPQNSAI